MEPLVWFILESDVAYGGAGIGRFSPSIIFSALMCRICWSRIISLVQISFIKFITVLKFGWGLSPAIDIGAMLEGR